MIKVRPTRTDAAGNGYYRGTDGKYYYGNVKNGYLKETIQERNQRLARESAAREKSGGSAGARGKGNAGGTVSLAEQAELGAAGTSALGVFGSILTAIVVFVAAVAITGGLMILTAVIGSICTVIGVVVVWARAYSIIPQIFSEFGVTPWTLLTVLPMLLSILILLVCLVKTFTRHRLYAWHLLIAYAIIFIPYAVMQCGGIEAVSQGLVTPDVLLYALINTAGCCGFFPAMALFLFHTVDKRVRQRQQCEEEVRTAKTAGSRRAKFNQ